MTFLSCFSFSFSFAICTVKVNKNRTFTVTGGKYEPCEPDNGKTCEIDIKNEDSSGDPATRHHILNKQLWVDALNKSLNDENAKAKILEMLKAQNAPENIITNIDSTGSCASNTNSWLTWLPVNLVLGPAPQERSWDPSDSYDQWAVTFIPKEFQKSMSALANPNTSDTEVATIIASLPVREEPWLANEESSTTGVEWVRAENEDSELKYCTNQIAQDNNNTCPNHA